MPRMNYHYRPAFQRSQTPHRECSIFEIGNLLFRQSIPANPCSRSMRVPEDRKMPMANRIPKERSCRIYRTIHISTHQHFYAHSYQWTVLHCRAPEHYRPSCPPTYPLAFYQVVATVSCQAQLFYLHWMAQRQCGWTSLTDKPVYNPTWTCLS